MIGILGALLRESALLSKLCGNGDCPVVVIAYHDVCGAGDFRSWLRVDVATFEEQIRLLSSIGNFIYPQELFEPKRHKAGRPNFLITFDDGFAGVCDYAVPVLMKHRAPALFFVSTWNMESGEPFWFDRVIRPIQDHNLPALDLRDLGLDSYYFSPSGGTNRWDDIQRLLEDIKRANTRKGEGLVSEVIARLDKVSGTGTDRGKPSLPLNRLQIEEMQRSGLCHFGSHSHRHEILISLTDDILMSELMTSRQILEGIVGTEVQSLSYPNGNHDERVRSACRIAGFRQGFTTIAGTCDRYTDPMAVPRILVGGYDSATRFALKLAGLAFGGVNKRNGRHVDGN